jgi:predicted component of type VI protein secretion system
MFRFIQANYQTFHSNAKNASAAFSGSVTSADFDLSPGTISALTGT